MKIKRPHKIIDYALNKGYNVDEYEDGDFNIWPDKDNEDLYIAFVPKDEKHFYVSATLEGNQTLAMLMDYEDIVFMLDNSNIWINPENSEGEE